MAETASAIGRFFERNLDSRFKATFAAGLKMSVVEAWNLAIAVDLTRSARLEAAEVLESAVVGISSERCSGLNDSDILAV
jgi:hypothetical protein